MRDWTWRAGALVAATAALVWAPRCLAFTLVRLALVPPSSLRVAPLAAALVAGLTVAWRLRHRRGGERLVAAALLLWIVPVLASACLTAPDPLFFWGSLLPYLAALILFVVLVAAPPPAGAVADATALMAMVLASSVLLDAFGVSSLGGRMRPGGLTGNRDFAGELLALALPACVGRLVGWRRAALPLVGAALALTRCRTAWLAAGVVIAILLLLDRGARRTALALIVAGALVAPLLPARVRWSEPRPYLATLARLCELGGGSGAVRVAQHRALTRVLAGHWLGGLGPGGWQRAIARVDRALAINRIPHSDYLRSLADGGLLSLAGLLSCYALALVLAWRGRRHDPTLLAAVAAAALVSSANCPLFRVETLLVTVAALAAAARLQAQVYSVHSSAPPSQASASMTAPMRRPPWRQARQLS